MSVRRRAIGPAALVRNKKGGMSGASWDLQKGSAARGEPRGRRARGRSGPAFADFDAPAQHFGIGIGGLSEEVFVVGAHGEQGRVHAGQRSAEALDFIAAQAHGDGHAVGLQGLDMTFDAHDVVVRLDHAVVFDKVPEKYTFLRPKLTKNRRNKGGECGIG